MKLKNPIQINFKDFFLKGQFDYIKPGQTKEWILNNFPDPDGFDNDLFMSKKCNIWTYSAVELHFDHDKLFLIWCDNLECIKDSKSIKYEKWILDNLSEMTLIEVQKILNSEKVNYSVKLDNDNKNAIIKIRQSGVCLWFENQKKNDEDIDEFEDFNEFKLFAFAKSASDFDSFERNF